MPILTTMHTTYPVHKKQSRSLLAGVIGTLLGAALSFLVIWNFQAILDWWYLRGYVAPSQVSALADETTMTPEARKLFYVNHPQILTASSFATYCQVGAEKTIILGCYQGGDHGIYLYKVTDARLSGVIETTAAHEMLHAAYARLSPSKKASIDAALENYYEHDLTDERIKQTIDAYRSSEPTELLNEMHSIFATEIASLPSGLESHYKAYFSNRGAVVAIAARYQSEFTSRRDQTAAYDTQLSALKTQIDAHQASLKVARGQLDALYAKMQRLRQSGDSAAYNALVDGYNAQANTYNALIATTKSEIQNYNDIVEKRNAVAFEERSLAQALSSQPVAP